jgi:hypothetical protein
METLLGPDSFDHLSAIQFDQRCQHLFISCHHK